MPQMLTLELIANAIKCTLVLPPAALVGVVVPDGQPRVTLNIKVAGRTVTATIASKSLRRAVAAIDASGPDNIALILQGKLVGSSIEEAGLSAMPKVVKQESVAAA